MAMEYFIEQDTGRVLLYCNTSDFALAAPVFDSVDQCDAFLDHCGREGLGDDLRAVDPSDVSLAWTRWIRQLNDEHGGDWVDWDEDDWADYRRRAAGRGEDDGDK